MFVSFTVCFNSVQPLSHFIETTSRQISRILNVRSRVQSHVVQEIPVEKMGRKRAQLDVSLKLLLESGEIEPGREVLQVASREETRHGDLNPDGSIVFEGKQCIRKITKVVPS